MKFLFIFLFTSFSAHAGWQRTFTEDFLGTSLNRSVWKTKDFWGNQTLGSELQCYLPDAFAVGGHTLKIIAKPHATPRSECKNATKDQTFSSGMITTAKCNPWETGAHCAGLNGFSQLYGYFEVRAKLPAGRGLWPAFWLMPADGAWPPEMDIMENLGHDTKTVHLTYHYKDSRGAHKSNGKAFYGPDYSAAFHRFGLDWQPGLLIWYVDGVERHRVAGPDVSAKASYLLLNLAVGGG